MALCQAQEGTDSKDGPGWLLLHVAKRLGVEHASGILPALNRLQGQGMRMGLQGWGLRSSYSSSIVLFLYDPGAFAECHTALQTLQQTLLPEKLYRSPTSTMRSLLTLYRTLGAGGWRQAAESAAEVRLALGPPNHSSRNAPTRLTSAILS